MIPMQQIFHCIGQLPRTHMLVVLWNILNIVNSWEKILSTRYYNLP